MRKDDLALTVPRRVVRLERLHEQRYDVRVLRNPAASLTFPPLNSTDVVELERALAAARIKGRYALTVLRAASQREYSVVIFLNKGDKDTEREILTAVEYALEII